MIFGFFFVTLFPCFVCRYDPLDYSSAIDSKQAHNKAPPADEDDEEEDDLCRDSEYHGLTSPGERNDDQIHVVRVVDNYDFSHRRLLA